MRLAEAERSRPQLASNVHVAGEYVAVASEVRVESADLRSGERTTRGVTGYIRETLRSRGSGMRGGSDIFLGVVLGVMTHEGAVGKHRPIDAVVREILLGGFMNGQIAEAARALADHAEREQLARRRGGLAPDVELVGVPGLGPVLGILVQRVKKEVMKEP